MLHRTKWSISKAIRIHGAEPPSSTCRIGEAMRQLSDPMQLTLHTTGASCRQRR